MDILNDSETSARPLCLHVKKAISSADIGMNYIYLQIDKMNTNQYQFIYEWLVAEVGVDWIINRLDEETIKEFFNKKHNKKRGE